MCFYGKLLCAWSSTADILTLATALWLIQKDIAFISKVQHISHGFHTCGFFLPLCPPPVKLLCKGSVRHRDWLSFVRIFASIWGQLHEVVALKWLILSPLKEIKACGLLLVESLPNFYSLYTGQRSAVAEINARGIRGYIRFTEVGGNVQIESNLSGLGGKSTSHKNGKENVVKNAWQWVFVLRTYHCMSVHGMIGVQSIVVFTHSYCMQWHQQWH